MKSRSHDGLAVKGLLKFKHKSCFQNNTVEKKKKNTLFAGFGRSVSITGPRTVLMTSGT